MARPQTMQRDRPGPRQNGGGEAADLGPGRAEESRRGLDSVKEPPTADALRHQIDFGRTSDKVPFPDPATAPLGTDDEAAGRPPTRRERRGAWLHEQTIGRLLGASRAKPDHEGEAWVTPVFIAGIILCGVVIVLGALISI